MLLRAEAQAGIQGSSFTSGQQRNPGLHCHRSLGTVTWCTGIIRNGSQGRLLPPSSLNADCQSCTCGAGLPEVHLSFGSHPCSEHQGAVQGSLCGHGMTHGLSSSAGCLVASSCLCLPLSFSVCLKIPI